jgi:hypothetical protein
VVNSQNEKSTTTDVDVINEAEKLLIYSIGKIYTNLSKLKCSSTKISKTKTAKLANLYIPTLRGTLQPILDDYFTNKIVSSLLYKVLFSNLSILYNFYQYGFCLHGNYSPPLQTKDPEEIKKYLERAKISLLTCFKIFLKEFNLMKFYQQAADMSGIKVDDTDFSGRNKKKIKIVNNLLGYIGDAVLDYRHKIVYMNSICKHGTKEYENLFYTNCFTSFYYWIKIANFLLKQYEQTMSDEELKRKINVRLYRYLSIVLIFLCTGEAVTSARELVKCDSLHNFPDTKSLGINKIKKLLDKISKTLHDIYFTMMYDKENTSFLIATSKKFPYIDYSADRIISNWFFGEIGSFLYDLKQSLVGPNSIINYKSESSREDLHYIIRIAGEISFTIGIIHSIIYKSKS